MVKNQKFSPKYWVAHDPATDDVLIKTVSKSLNDCIQKMYAQEGEDACDNYTCILVGLEFVSDYHETFGWVEAARRLDQGCRVQEYQPLVDRWYHVNNKVRQGKLYRVAK